MNELRARIVEETDELRGNRNIIRNAVRGMRSRAEVCVARNGGHVEGQWAREDQ